MEPASPPRSRRSVLLTGLVLLLAGLFLFLAFRGVDWTGFWNALLHGRYEFLLLTIPISCASLFLRSIRWNVLLRAEKKIPVLSVFWANMAGYLGNAVLPARAGELVRSAYLGRESGLGTSYILATALAERVFDVIALVSIGSIALLLQATVPALFTGALLVMAVGGCLAGAAFIAAPFGQGFILRLLDRFRGNQRWILFAREQIVRFLAGARSLHSVRTLAAFVFLTAVVWMTDAFCTTISVRIISQTITISQALILLAALGLSSAIPSTPGYVGAYQFAAVIVLVPLGFSQAEALAFILISQVFNLLVVGFWGLIGIWQLRRAGKTSISNS